MLLRIAIPALLLFAGSVAAPTSVRAAQSYDNCTGFIESLPATISTQGTWCLKQDLSTAMVSGYAITIDTNNVTIDCNDFKLGGLAGGTGADTRGIFAGSRFNATVRHCNIRGFTLGIHFYDFGSGSGGHVIEDNRFDGNTYIGMEIVGDGSVVRRNLVLDTGGSTLAWTLGLAQGIVAGRSVDVLDNTVSGVLPSVNGAGDGRAVGITTANNTSGSISGNRVRGLVPVGNGQPVGIENYQSGRISLRDNQVTGTGNSDGTGMACSDSNARAKDNMIIGFDVGLDQCADDGNVVAALSLG